MDHSVLPIVYEGALLRFQVHPPPQILTVIPLFITRFKITMFMKQTTQTIIKGVVAKGRSPSLLKFDFLNVVYRWANNTYLQIWGGGGLT